MSSRSGGRGRRWAALFLVVSAACTPGRGDAPARPAPAGARPGGTLTVAMDRPGAVDPLDAYEPSGLLVARTMCDTLVEADPETGELRPGIAESWSVLDGGRQLTFRLRSTARFSDGRAVRAGDVVASLTRAASPAFAGRAAPLLSRIVGWDRLQDQIGGGTGRRTRLAGVRALNAQTVEVALVDADADAIRLFTHPVTAPVSSAAIAADPDAASRVPVCSGPYRLAAPWSPTDEAFTLERVPGYVGRSTVSSRGGSGYADEIVFRIAGSAPSTDADLRFHPAAPAGDAPAGAARHRAPGPAVEYLAFPTASASPYRDVRVRRALSAAIDRDRLVEATTPGRRTPATGYLPPALGRWIDARRCPTTGAVAARELLRRAGLEPSALPVRLTVNDDGPNRAIADEIARQWRDDLGLTVEVGVVPFAELLTAATTGAGFPGPVRVSWAAPVPSVDAHLAPLFSSGAVHQANFGRWDDPVWDELLASEARQATDDDDRRLAHRRLHDRLCRQVPAIPLTVSLAAVDVREDRIATATEWLDSSTGAPALREVWIRR